MTLTIDKQDHGKTVKEYLFSDMHFSVSLVKKLKARSDGILLNGKHVTVRHMLRAGESLSINEKDSPNDVNETIEPSPISINILFENNDIMVIDKPAYMPTHPSHNHHYDTVANAVAHIYNERGLPLVFRPMGRLDRNTSGIVVLAKNAISASFLSYSRRHEMIQKRYLALVCGRLDSHGEMQVIDTHMKRSADSVIMRCVTDEADEGAMHAVTHWKSLYTSDEISIVEAIPKTGRTHQLRVHFAHIGHPILGDDIYGCASPYIGRHALHAAMLSIPLPYSEETVTFRSNIPDDIKSAFLKLTGVEINNAIINKGEICS